MKISRIAADELDAGLKQRWNELRGAEAALGSPYFGVEFTEAAGQVRDDVFVGVMEADGLVQGFFPYQLKSRRVAGAVGGQLSDWHGAIAPSSLNWNVSDLLRACRVDIWDFDHVPRAQQAFQAHVKAHAASPVLDLSQGYAAYLESRKAAGAQRVSQIQRKARKFERELGTLRFEADCRDRKAFEQVLQWKREQCLRTNVPDFLSWGWTTALIERTWAVDTAAFAGRLSVLWHEEAVVAAHYGIRSATTWHWWFPTYNKDFADYSPGGILLLRLAEAAATSGQRHIDLGKGEDVYKQSFATGELALVEGCVLVPSMTSSWRKAQLAGRDLIQRSPALNRAWSAIQPLRAWFNTRAKNELQHHRE